MTSLILLQLCCVWCILLLQCTAKPPHIVVIIGDDVGWSDVGFHNTGTDVKTPVLNELAKTGRILDRHYTYKYCSPTRSSYLTGRYPLHVNEVNPGFVEGGGVSLNFTMLPQKLKGADYISHHVGKWHLGMSSPHRVPAGRGFNTSIGYLGGAEDHITQRASNHVDLWDTNVPAWNQNGTYGDLIYSSRAVQIINGHDKNIPLYLNLALQVCHDPQEAPSKYIDLYPGIYPARATFNGMASVLDEAIGNVTQALKDNGMWDDTFFLFFADNGGASGVNSMNGNNYPLRGGKHTDFEGGVRGSAIVNGGLLPDDVRGKPVEGYIHVADWYATICNLAGVDPTDNHVGVPGIDSMDMFELVSGKNTTSPRTIIPLASGISGENVGDAGIIKENYKLVLGNQKKIGYWTGPLYPNGTKNVPSDDYRCDRIPCLFDIIADPTEHINLAESMPEKVQELTALLNKFKSGAFQTGKDGEFDCQDSSKVVSEKYHDFWGPFCQID